MKKTEITSNPISTLVAEGVCVCTSLRKASRAVDRNFEVAFAKAGITATQFAILRNLERNGTLPLRKLADNLVLERTSLYRSIQPLIKQDLVKLQGGFDKRIKEVLLTQEGKDKILEALPYWQQAQNDFLSQFGLNSWSSLLPLLQDVTNSAQSVFDTEE